MQTESAANRVKELINGKDNTVGVKVGVRRSKSHNLLIIYSFSLLRRLQWFIIHDELRNQ